jgi:uncharacterized membrane protein
MSSLLNRAIELLLGFPRGFLVAGGDWAVHFNPPWPGRNLIGAVTWNAFFAALIVIFVGYVCTRERRSRSLQIFLGTLRFTVFALLLFLLNRPVLAVTVSRVERSVLAIMIDDSGSMRVPDVGPDDDPQSRLAAAQTLLCGREGGLLKSLAAKHDLRFYRFDGDATLISDASQQPADGARAAGDELDSTVRAIQSLKAEGNTTAVLPSLLTVARDLQGQRSAGIVLISDGRDVPAENLSTNLQSLKGFGVKVYPVTVGSDRQPKNIAVQSMQVEDVAFNGDIVNVQATVRATGYEPNHPVHLVLKDAKTDAILPGPDGKPAEITLNIPDDKPIQTQLAWQTSAVGKYDLSFEAVKQPGEVNEADNSRTSPINVLDAKISVLFVDGYPRWDYRYLKNTLLRDKSFAVSCLLTSADFNFLQEGNKSLPSASSGTSGHFPDTIEQLMDYDVLVIGDVDPHYFSDKQQQLINDFVSRGGGFLMVAGERWSPQAYRDMPIAAVLPVALTHVESTDPEAIFDRGFRPVVTASGRSSGIYRFFPSAQTNDDFLHNDLPPLFWYCKGVTAKPGVGEVLSEHPTDVGDDGHKVPLLVSGRFGGRTLFSGIDDSWRWRFYTDEHVFDAYWIQQLRYLARGRKIDQRRLTLSLDQTVHELGDQVQLSMHVIDPSLVRQLPDQIRVNLLDAQQELIGSESLLRQAGGNGDQYSGSFIADRIGKFVLQVPPVAAGMDAISSSLEVIVPQMELNDPRVDRVRMSRLASETLGQSIDFKSAAEQIDAIPSAEKVVPKISAQPLWGAPLLEILFACLISTEWIARKLNGLS